MEYTVGQKIQNIARWVILSTGLILGTGVAMKVATTPPAAAEEEDEKPDPQWKESEKLVKKGKKRSTRKIRPAMTPAMKQTNKMLRGEIHNIDPLALEQSMLNLLAERKGVDEEVRAMIYRVYAAMLQAERDKLVKAGKTREAEDMDINLSGMNERVATERQMLRNRDLSMRAEDFYRAIDDEAQKEGFGAAKTDSDVTREKTMRAQNVRIQETTESRAKFEAMMYFGNLYLFQKQESAKEPFLDAASRYYNVKVKDLPANLTNRTFQNSAAQRKAMQEERERLRREVFSASAFSGDAERQARGQPTLTQADLLCHNFARATTAKDRQLVVKDIDAYIGAVEALGADAPQELKDTATNLQKLRTSGNPEDGTTVRNNIQEDAPLGLELAYQKLDRVARELATDWGKAKTDADLLRAAKKRDYLADRLMELYGAILEADQGYIYDGAGAEDWRVAYDKPETKEGADRYKPQPKLLEQNRRRANARLDMLDQNLGAMAGLLNADPKLGKKEALAKGVVVLGRKVQRLFGFILRLDPELTKDTGKEAEGVTDILNDADKEIVQRARASLSGLRAAVNSSKGGPETLMRARASMTPGEIEEMKKAAAAKGEMTPEGVAEYSQSADPKKRLFLLFWAEHELQGSIKRHVENLRGVLQRLGDTEDIWEKVKVRNEVFGVESKKKIRELVKNPLQKLIDALIWLMDNWHLIVLGAAGTYLGLKAAAKYGPRLAAETAKGTLKLGWGGLVLTYKGGKWLVLGPKPTKRVVRVKGSGAQVATVAARTGDAIEMLTDQKQQTLVEYALGDAGEDPARQAAQAEQQLDDAAQPRIVKLEQDPKESRLTQAQRDALNLEVERQKSLAVNLNEEKRALAQPPAPVVPQEAQNVARTALIAQIGDLQTEFLGLDSQSKIHGLVRQGLLALLPITKGQSPSPEKISKAVLDIDAFRNTKPSLSEEEWTLFGAVTKMLKAQQ